MLFRLPLDGGIYFSKGTNLAVDPVILVHGGAWAIPDDMVEAHLRGVEAAAAAGWQVLHRGGSSLDAVEAAVVAMEEDETFDAGRGSFLNMDGRVQLDALIMDGATLRAGGVGCVEHIRNPVRAAKKILTESPHVYFVGTGAERFAQEHGIESVRQRRADHRARGRAPARGQEARLPADAGRVRPHAARTTRWARSRSMREGNIAAATSTGGTLNKAPGPRGRFVADRLRLLCR